MKNYEVIITENAKEDINDIYWYVLNVSFSRDIANNYVKRIMKEIKTLSTFPLRVPLMSIEPWRSFGYRKMVIKNYSVYFIVKGDRVMITDVLNNSCNVETKLKEMNIS